MKGVFRGSTGCALLVGVLACPGVTSAQVCVGDCNGNGEVMVDEIVACIGSALGVLPVEDCQACDADSDDFVQVDELVTSVALGLDVLRLSACTRQACLDSGGLDTLGSCCIGAGDFPNTCDVGVCGCAPESSEQVSVCECQPGNCFDGNRCVPLAARDCLESGGTLSSASCCLATGDFPDTCGVGACSCAPEFSHLVRVCECEPGKCFDGLACVPIAEAGCTESGGSVASRSCCRGAGDFPDTCAVGACACSPEDSESVLVCDCPLNRCFDGMECMPIPPPLMR
jgi:hypothetical protein